MKPGRYCKNLRTKSMYVGGPEEENLAQPSAEIARTSHCWCNRTLTETGPDDRPVGVDACHSSRTCFEE